MCGGLGVVRPPGGCLRQTVREQAPHPIERAGKRGAAAGMSLALLGEISEEAGPVLGLGRSQGRDPITHSQSPAQNGEMWGWQAGKGVPLASHRGSGHRLTRKEAICTFGFSSM